MELYEESLSDLIFERLGEIKKHGNREGRFFSKIVENEDRKLK